MQEEDAVSPPGAETAGGAGQGGETEKSCVKGGTPGRHWHDGMKIKLQLFTANKENLPRKQTERHTFFYFLFMMIIRVSYRSWRAGGIRDYNKGLYFLALRFWIPYIAIRFTF